MGRVRTGFKLGIFLSSYIPLFLILAYKHYSASIQIPFQVPYLAGISIPILSLFWVILSIISLLALGLVFRVTKGREPEPKPIKDVRNRNDQITNYSLVYIFPFVVLDLSKLVNWIAFVIFFITIGIIQIRSNNLYINPVLGIVGYNIYEVETGDERLVVLSREFLTQQDTHISATKISRGVYIHSTNGS